MSVEYRLLTYRDDRNAPRAGVLVDGLVYAAAMLLKGTECAESNTVLGLLQSWPAVQRTLRQSVGGLRPDEGVPLAQLKLEAPILYPGAVFATGGNYTDHLQEMAKTGVPTLEQVPSG